MNLLSWAVVLELAFTILKHLNYTKHDYTYLMQNYLMLFFSGYEVMKLEISSFLVQSARKFMAFCFFPFFLCRIFLRLHIHFIWHTHTPKLNAAVITTQYLNFMKSWTPDGVEARWHLRTYREIREFFFLPIKRYSSFRPDPPKRFVIVCLGKGGLWTVTVTYWPNDVVTTAVTGDTVKIDNLSTLVLLKSRDGAITCCRLVVQRRNNPTRLLTNMWCFSWLDFTSTISVTSGDVF